MDKKWIVIILVALALGFGVAVKVFNVPHTPGSPEVAGEHGPEK